MANVADWRGRDQPCDLASVPESGIRRSGVAFTFVRKATRPRSNIRHPSFAYLELQCHADSRVMKSRISRGITKVKRTSEELIALIRKDLVGRYADVPISIQRSGDSWIAVADIESAMTRERIENVVKQIRKFNDLA